MNMQKGVYIMNDKIKCLAIELDIDYGDILTKKQLVELFGFKYPSFDSELSPVQMRAEWEKVDWCIMAAMDIFKTYLRELRFMHLQYSGKNGEYIIIRPDQHVDIALANLRRTIKKGFKNANDILDATKVELLDGAEKLTLTTAQINVQKLEGLFTKQSMRMKIKEQNKIE